MNKFVFDNYKTEKPGVLYFIPNNVKSYKKGHRCYGFGSVKYPEGSIYTGNIYFDGKNYNKIGFGKQVFTRSFLKNISIEGESIYCYVGEYDYRKNDWIYGQGVIYLLDRDSKPSHFIKGRFDGLNKVGDYQGDFDYSNLLDGYTKEMELDYSERKNLFHNELSRYISNTQLEALFIGDSYMEFWHYPLYSGVPFNELYPQDKYLNLGLGGSTYKDWLYYLPLIKLDEAPKRIFICLGINDMHFYYKVEEAIANLEECVSIINRMFPKTHIYALTPCYAPSFKNKARKISMFNNKLKSIANDKNISIIDFGSHIKNLQNEQKIDYFYEDGLHLNENGYKELKNLVDEVIANDHL